MIEGVGVEEHQKISWVKGEQKKGGMSERATEAGEIKSNTKKGRHGPTQRNDLISCKPRIMVGGCQGEGECGEGKLLTGLSKAEDEMSIYIIVLVTIDQNVYNNGK